MALIRASKGGGGGSETVTVIWSNENQSSNFAGGQYVALSDSIENYDFIQVAYKISKGGTATDPQRTGYVRYSVDDFKNFVVDNDHVAGAIGVRHVTLGPATRTLGYRSSDNKVYFGNAIRADGSTSNDLAIPISISGIIV